MFSQCKHQQIQLNFVHISEILLLKVSVRLVRVTKVASQEDRKWLCNLLGLNVALIVSPAAVSLRYQDCPYGGAELSCLDPRWLHDFPQRPCCQCHLGPAHAGGGFQGAPWINRFDQRSDLGRMTSPLVFQVPST